jgi:hypothetical protein
MEEWNDGYNSFRFQALRFMRCARFKLRVSSFDLASAYPPLAGVRGWTLPDLKIGSKNGRMEEWKNGRMEEWKNGRRNTEHRTPNIEV